MSLDERNHHSPNAGKAFVRRCLVRLKVIKAALGERYRKGCEGRQEESLGHDWKEQFQ